MLFMWLLNLDLIQQTAIWTYFNDIKTEQLNIANSKFLTHDRDIEHLLNFR